MQMGFKACLKFRFRSLGNDSRMRIMARCKSNQNIHGVRNKSWSKREGKAHQRNEETGVFLTLSDDLQKIYHRRSSLFVHSLNAPHAWMSTWGKVRRFWVAAGKDKAIFPFQECAIVYVFETSRQCGSGVECQLSQLRVATFAWTNSEKRRSERQLAKKNETPSHLFTFLKVIRFE